MTLIKFLLLSSTLLVTSMVNAAKITDAYVRATPPHTQNSAAFMNIHNNANKPLHLISASSDIAERVELHSHIMNDGMMQMRQVQSITIEPNSQVALRPGGFHVMLFGLKSSLAEGDRVTLTLYFDNHDKIMIDTPVKRITMHSEMKHN